MVYHKVEVMIVDNYMGAETVTIECINYSTQFTEVMTIDEYEGTEVVTIGIRAVDPRMRGDGFDADEFLRRSQIEEFLLNLQKAEGKEIEPNEGGLDGKINLLPAMEESEADIFDLVVDTKLKIKEEAIEKTAAPVFDEMSESKRKCKKQKSEVLSKMLGFEDTTWEPGGQSVSKNAPDTMINEVHNDVDKAKNTPKPDFVVEGRVGIFPTIRSVVDRSFASHQTHQNAKEEDVEQEEQQMFDEMPVRNLAKREVYSLNFSDFILLFELQEDYSKFADLRVSLRLVPDIISLQNAVGAVEANSSLILNDQNSTQWREEPPGLNESIKSQEKMALVMSNCEDSLLSTTCNLVLQAYETCQLVLLENDGKIKSELEKVRGEIIYGQHLYDIQTILLEIGACQPAHEQAPWEISINWHRHMVELIMGFDFIRLDVTVHAPISAHYQCFFEVVYALLKCGVDANATGCVFLQLSKSSLHTNSNYSVLVVGSRQIFVVLLLFKVNVKNDVKVHSVAWFWDEYDEKKKKEELVKKFEGLCKVIKDVLGDKVEKGFCLVHNEILLSLLQEIFVSRGVTTLSRAEYCYVPRPEFIKYVGPFV